MKVLLVEDDTIVRACVATAARQCSAEPRLMVADSVEQATAMAAAAGDVQLALLGLAKEAADAAKLVQQFHRIQCDLAVVILAPTEEEDRVVQVLDAGAAGFINKQASTRALLNSLRAAMEFGICVPVTVAMARGLYNLPQDSPVREIAMRLFAARPEDHSAAIARLMLRGCSQPAIARRTGISAAAVRNEVSALLKGLAVTNRTDAICVLAATLIGTHFDPQAPRSSHN